MVDFKNRNMMINESYVIKNGKPVNGYKISENIITLQDIENLYAIYESSMPDIDMKPSIFKAKTEKQLKLSEIVFACDRSKAKDKLEQTLLESIISKTIIYPNMQHWFWQSEKYKNLIIPRWLFTQECPKQIKYFCINSHEPELWSRNIAGKRLRKSLNEDTMSSGNLTFADYFAAAKTEISEKNEILFFTNNVLTILLQQYMNQLPKKYNAHKAEIGQYVSHVKKSKNALEKERAISNLISNCPLPKTELNCIELKKAYIDFVDYQTLMFIQTFILGTEPVKITRNINAYTVDYISRNKDTICEYVYEH